MSPLCPEKNDSRVNMKTCPVCKRASAEEFRPFCSKRCAELDLAQWLKGAYAIPAVKQDDQEDDGRRAELPQGD